MISRLRVIFILNLIAFFSALAVLHTRFVPSGVAVASTSSIELINSLGGSITSVAVSGTVAYVGQGGTFATLDISNPISISLLAYLPLPDFAKRIQIVGSLAYVADGAGGLQIIDISDALNPQLRGSYSIAGTTNAVSVVGDLAYIVSTTSFTSSLQIVDVTNPDIPIYQGGYSSASYAGYTGIDIQSGLAYVAEGSGLTILDVIDPTNPVLKGNYFAQGNYFGPGGFTDVKVTGNLAIAVGNDLEVIDISLPMTPTLLGLYNSGWWGRWSPWAL